jgi:transcriptional regulator with XRE-family HTH domain
LGRTASKWSTSRLSDSLVRLAGLHRLSANDLAALLHVRRQTVSLWMNGHYRPNVEAAAKLYDLFEIDVAQLATRPFSELLPEIVDADRFERVEQRIKRGAEAAQPSLDE